MAYISISKTNSSCSVYVGGLDTSYYLSDRRAYFTIRSGGWSSSDNVRIGAYASSSPSVSFSGLIPNTRYDISVTIDYSDGSTNLSDYFYTDGGGGNPDPDPPGDTTNPVINITNIYASKVGTEIRIYVDWTSSDNVELLMHRGEITNSYGELTWDGFNMSKYQQSHYFNKDGSNAALVNNKTYTVAITAYDTSGNLRTATRSITISVSVKPGPWTGFTSIAAGGSYASSGGLYQYPIHAVEWNNFTSHINLFRDYKGLPLTTFTSVISKNTNFTATIINQAINAINQIGYAIPTVASGGIITANTFLLMKSRLNAIV